MQHNLSYGPNSPHVNFSGALILNSPSNFSGSGVPEKPIGIDFEGMNITQKTRKLGASNRSANNSFIMGSSKKYD